MRVIGGKLKGKRLVSPRGDNVRPTLDRIKETLFNIIQFDVADSVFLDLFAGSGGIGIEAYSRGAAEVIFCDRDRDSLKVLKTNLASLGADGCFVYEGDFTLLLKSQPPRKFDFIYVDPPYAGALAAEALKIIADKKLLKEGGRVIVERLSDDARPLGAEGLTFLRERKMGNVTLCFFGRNEDE